MALVALFGNLITVDRPTLWAKIEEHQVLEKIVNLLFQSKSNNIFHNLCLKPLHYVLDNLTGS